MKHWKKVTVLILIALACSAYLSGCGNGVEFGVKKFTLTGAGA